MKLTMSPKELLSGSRSKSMLTAMFAQCLLKHFANDNSLKLIVVYDTKIRDHDFEEVHSHEEDYTSIPNQVLASIDESTQSEVCVWSPDTDVLILLLDLVSNGRLGTQTHFKFLTGKGTKYREIDVVEHMRVIGPHKCQVLIGLHRFLVLTGEENL